MKGIKSFLIITLTVAACPNTFATPFNRFSERIMKQMKTAINAHRSHNMWESIFGVSRKKQAVRLAAASLAAYGAAREFGSEASYEQKRIEELKAKMAQTPAIKREIRECKSNKRLWHLGEFGCTGMSAYLACRAGQAFLKAIKK